MVTCSNSTSCAGSRLICFFFELLTVLLCANRLPAENKINKYLGVLESLSVYVNIARDFVT
jgi:hypothetical protein